MNIKCDTSYIVHSSPQLNYGVLFRFSFNTVVYTKLQAYILLILSRTIKNNFTISEVKSNIVGSSRWSWCPATNKASWWCLTRSWSIASSRPSTKWCKRPPRARSRRRPRTPAAATHCNNTSNNVTCCLHRCRSHVPAFSTCDPHEHDSPQAIINIESYWLFTVGRMSRIPLCVNVCAFLCILWGC